MARKTNFSKLRAQHIKKVRDAQKLKRDIPDTPDTPEIIKVDYSESENYISSVADTKRIVSILPCPKCLKIGLTTSISTEKIFQKKIEIFCKSCGYGHTDYTAGTINNQLVAAMSLCGIRDSHWRRLWYATGQTFPASVKSLREIRVSQGPKMKQMARESVENQQELLKKI